MESSVKLELENILKYLNSLPCINWGGCVVAALSIYRWLQSQNIKAKFVYLYDIHDKYSMELFSTNQAVLDNESDYPVSCAHAVIKIGRKYYDSNGETNIENYRKHIINDEEFIVDSLNNINVWNYMFSRDYCIPKIEKKLKISLADVNRC